MLKRLFGIFDRRERRQFVSETENTFSIGTNWEGSERDRQTYDREKVLDDALDAWRFNPLARRIVGLTSQYVIGSGVELSSKHEGTLRFLRQWWDHPLNHMSTRMVEMSDELSRSGNLFILLSTDAAGMSYVRLVPASDIDHIDAAPNDVEQPLRFWPKATNENPDPEPWWAYTPYVDSFDETEPGSPVFRPVMLHYAVNRPAGGQWGESDLAPVLKWLQRYSGWLEDRARLNRYRNSFLFVVKSRFSSEADRATRQAALAATPPTPGSILVCDESESWEVLSAKLESSDANQDGLALKKLIAAGVGLPLHFLSEPESSTRTTAEAAGGPTFRYFEQRQEFFLWLVGDLARAVVQRRARVDRKVKPPSSSPRKGEGIEVVGSDISARDNVSLSMAAVNTMTVIQSMRERGLIDDTEALRLVYKAMGETVDLEEMLERGKQAGKWEMSSRGDAETRSDKSVSKRGRRGKIDPETGDLSPSAEGEVKE